MKGKDQRNKELAKDDETLETKSWDLSQGFLHSLYTHSSRALEVEGLSCTKAHIQSQASRLHYHRLLHLGSSSPTRISLSMSVSLLSQAYLLFMQIDT